MASVHKPSPHLRKTRPDDARGAKPGTTTILPTHGGSIGQAPHIPTEVTRMQARTLASYTSQADIAVKMGVNISTLRKHYADELLTGKADVKSAIGGKIVQQALKGDRASQFFYMRTFGGWGPKALLEVTGPNGGPIQHAHVDFSAFLAGKSPDELRLLLPLVDQLIASAGGAGSDTDPDGFEGSDQEGFDGFGDGGDEG